ncbi:four-carbon acid sugar kinase family protein [Ancylobacter sonchi]|uniref:3-oxo-tetronate kinase n=1 Tax=Ancylobacter sonchi TaxID=1937790 RepID=UPI001BD1F835|nr:3-oxo-tetronate kinase [Ancylobacter sonchi]MBS7536021.1 four-carbon acid sugar kinase family protein [Ancylobacter sonchi]
MTALLAAIADDYTGASDLANTWRKSGLRTVQTIGVPTDEEAFGEIDAIVVSLKIRSAPVAEAVSSALAAETLLRAIGVRHVMYKVCSTFDSTDDGNIGQITDALVERSGQGWVLVTPAFPETGRTVYKGNLFVNDVPLNESPLRHHPLNPMLDANLARVLKRQSGRPAHVLDVQTVKAGLDACREKIAYFPDTQPSIIADAIDDGDLEVLGRLALETAVSTGASGLGYGLAKATLETHHSESFVASGLQSVGGHSAAIAGSCSARTLEQIAVAEKHMPVLRLDPERLIAGPRMVDEALAFARRHLETGPVLIAASASPEAVALLQLEHGKLETGHAIECALAAIALGLVDAGVRRLVVAGGETSGAVVDTLGIRSFEIGEELAPGVPMLRTLGQPGGDLAMALKSGNFGGEDFFPEALSRLT